MELGEEIEEATLKCVHEMGKKFNNVVKLVGKKLTLSQKFILLVSIIIYE